MAPFEPAFSPTTTKLVRFDTLPAARPPRETIASLAPSRVKRSRVPVTTTVRPSRVRSTRSASASSAVRTPQVAQRSRISRCQSTSSHSRHAAAIVGPTPSTPDSSSSSASRRASRDPKRVASARAAVGPTWRTDRATSTRHSGRPLAASSWASMAVAFLPGAAARLTSPSLP